MSHLGERLRRIARGRGAAIGFGASASTERVSPMLVIAGLPSSASADVVRRALDAGADLVVFDGLPPAMGEALTSVDWGVCLEAPTAADLAALREQKADFVVFGADGTPATLLRDEALGKALVAEPSAESSALAALSFLPLDALWVPTGAVLPTGRTVREVIALRRLTELARKPLLLELAADMAPEALAGLVGSGVLGVVVAGDDERLRAVRAAVDSLPKDASSPPTEPMLPPARPSTR